MEWCANNGAASKSKIDKFDLVDIKKGPIEIILYRAEGRSLCG
jgi:hypothetical protein